MPTFPTPISPRAAILARRHITNEQADILEVGPMAYEDVVSHLGYRPKGSIAFIEALPYWGPDGHPLGEPQFFRFRFNYTPGWEPPEGDWKDYPKYRSPRIKGEFAFLPRGVGMDWTAILGEPKVPLIITEGEYKAIRVCSAWDQPCIGLGGVWMFHASKPGWPMGMENMNFLDRECYIAFDADKESTFEHPLKSGVAGAANQLVTKLQRDGATPWLLYIARTKTFTEARLKDLNVKMGIDDFIDAGGTIEELLATRENPVDDPGMAYLLSTYAVYTGPSPGILNIETGVFYRVSDWFNVEANCIGTKMVEKGGKLVPQRIKYTQMYMESTIRPDFAKFVFEPSLAPGLDLEKGIYNRWTGMAVEGHQGPGEAQRAREIVGIWRKLIEGLFGEDADYFEQWVADIFQYPGRKTTIGVLLRSSLNGIGKSLLGEILRDMVGMEHSVRTELDNALHHFNSLMGSKVLIQIDEANDFQKQHDSAIKNMISAEEITVTLKGRDSIILKNYARLFVTSNSIAPIRVDEHNRRVFIKSPNLTIADERGAWAIWVRDIVAKELRSEEGLRLLRFYLDNIDLREWNPTAHVRKTADMFELVQDSRSQRTDFVSHLWEDFLVDPVGIWVMGGSMKAGPDSKSIWSQFKDWVKVNGGQALSHVMKIPGDTKTARVWIYVRQGVRPLETEYEEGQGYKLAKGGLTKEELMNGMSSAEKSYNKWSGTSISDKF